MRAASRSPASLLAAGPEIFGRGPAAEARRLEAPLFFRHLAGDRKTIPPFRVLVLSRGKLDAPALEDAPRRTIGAIERGFLSARLEIR